MDNNNILSKRNYKKYGFNINLVVSILSATIIMVFFIFGFTHKDTFFNSVVQVKDMILIVFKPVFIWTIVLVFIVSIYISFSKMGTIRLGGSKARPKFSNFAWYAMLFSAGMGIGLMFYGIAEPLMYENATPLFSSSNNIDSALATAYFHWGIQAWIIYGIMGLALSFYSFNMNLPLAPRSLFYPVLKNKIYGVIGDIIDAIAVVTTLFALASSLGLGAIQVNSGFNYIFGLAISTNIQIIIVIIITFLATLSVISGLNKGVRILSELNLKLTFTIFLIFLIAGPTLTIISNGFHSIGLYLSHGFIESTKLGYYEDTQWISKWTLFYWSWWISWSVFVGMFIAKISYGRTIREFILSIMFIPTILTVLWFLVMGTSGFYANNLSNGELLNTINGDVSLALYATIIILFKNHILILLLEALAVILIISFFVTSSDSGCLVVDSLTNGGINKSPKKQKIFWSFLQGLLAIVLIITGGVKALDLIQMILIIVAVPISIILIYTSITIVVQLKKYLKEEKKRF